MDRDVKVEIFVAGDGMNYPPPGSLVTVHYTGYLADGTKFDSTLDRGKPFKFRCTDFEALRKSGKPITPQQVVLGLDFAVQRLSINERAKVYIPSKLAYGAVGFPGLIPPNTDLTFDLELVKFS